MTELTGTGALIRLILRRERLILPIWVALVVFLLIGQALRYNDLLPTEAVFVFGALPRFMAAIAWAAFIYTNFVGELFGPILFGASYQIANALQPFHYIPKITSGGELTLMPLLALLGATCALLIGGIVVFQRRDVGA
jgi:ABC-2 type transport system permease protein